ncbi:hypothetical protein ABZ820_38790 [Streptomyces diacarni]|uniref:hypothetical protein n=1 Tax=Streptomyces diacarni TaxID=2800381 RepID=UPI0033DC4D68
MADSAPPFYVSFTSEGAEGDEMLAHGCVVERVGGWIPSARISNAQLPAHWGVTDVWVRSRAGIATRHRARPGALLNVTSARGDRASARRGARTRALLAERGASTDAGHATAPRPQGRNAEVAVRAIADVCRVPGDTAHVNARATATPTNPANHANHPGDAVETAGAAQAAMIGRLLPYRSSVTVPQGVLGRSPQGRRCDRGRADRAHLRARAGPRPSPTWRNAQRRRVPEGTWTASRNGAGPSGAAQR